jgi:hypothetical protein
MSLGTLLLFSTIAIALIVSRGEINETITDGCAATSGFYHDIE